MDNPRIIHAPMNSRRYGVTAPITQYDYGYLLLPEGVELPTTYEVDFSNDEHKGTSLTVYGGSDGAEVPEELIRTGKDVFAFYYKIGEGYGKTDFTWRIPNHCRPDRDGETPTPTQQSSIDQLIVRSNEAVETAEEKAEEADTSARSAREDADRAERAKTGAETAQGKAEEAQESAERAKDDAETSERNASESERKAKGYAETASAKADAITGLTAQATTLPDGSSATASYDAETGVMSFGIPKGKDGIDGIDGDDGYSPTANVSKSGKTATITITDKNGTTSAQVSDGEDGAIGATPNLTIGTVETLEPTEPATATITGTPENPVLNLGIPQGEQGEVTTEEFLKVFVTDTASGSIASFSDGADDLPLKSLVVNINPVQSGSGDPSPDNVRPISGWTGMEIQHTKKNLFDNDTAKIHAVTCGTANEGEYLSRYGYEIYLPAGTYTIKAERDPSLTASRYIYGGVYKKSGNHDLVTAANIWAGKNGYTRTITVAEDECIIYFYAATSTTLADVKTYFSYFDITMWKGTEVGDYEPYQGTTIPINWQSEAGTVYSGRLDVLTGKLTVEMAGIQIKDTSWTTPSTNVFRTELDKKKEKLTIPMSDAYKSVNPVSAVVNLPNDSISVHQYWNATNYRKIVYIKDTRYTTVEEFVEAMGEHQIVYVLNTPIEIQLTPQQVNSFLGVNNIWADTGDTEVEYRADTKLYIERLTAPDSADMIADANITSGQYFMVGNSLYKATANIANGGQITVGTNATRVSLAQALNEINA